MENRTLNARGPFRVPPTNNPIGRTLGIDSSHQPLPSVARPQSNGGQQSESQWMVSGIGMSARLRSNSKHPSTGRNRRIGISRRLRHLPGRACSAARTMKSRNVGIPPLLQPEMPDRERNQDSPARVVRVQSMRARTNREAERPKPAKWPLRWIACTRDPTENRSLPS